MRMMSKSAKDCRQWPFDGPAMAKFASRCQRPSTRQQSATVGPSDAGPLGNLTVLT